MAYRARICFLRIREVRRLRSGGEDTDFPEVLPLLGSHHDVLLRLCSVTEQLQKGEEGERINPSD